MTLYEIKKISMLVHNIRKIIRGLQAFRENRTCNSKELPTTKANCSTKQTADGKKEIKAYYRGVSYFHIRA